MSSEVRGFFIMATLVLLAVVATNMIVPIIEADTNNVPVRYEDPDYPVVCYMYSRGISCVEVTSENLR